MRIEHTGNENREGGKKSLFWGHILSAKLTPDIRPFDNEEGRIIRTIGGWLSRSQRLQELVNGNIFAPLAAKKNNGKYRKSSSGLNIFLFRGNGRRGLGGLWVWIYRPPPPAYSRVGGDSPFYKTNLWSWMANYVSRHLGAVSQTASVPRLLQFRRVAASSDNVFGKRLAWGPLVRFWAPRSVKKIIIYVSFTWNRSQMCSLPPRFRRFGLIFTFPKKIITHDLTSNFIINTLWWKQLWSVDHSSRNKTKK